MGCENFANELVPTASKRAARSRRRDLEKGPELVDEQSGKGDIVWKNELTVPLLRLIIVDVQTASVCYIKLN